MSARPLRETSTATPEPRREHRAVRQDYRLAVAVMANPYPRPSSIGRRRRRSSSTDATADRLCVRELAARVVSTRHVSRVSAARICSPTRARRRQRPVGFRGELLEPGE
jgi:hypothetical protein